jgi:hypothetical protein
MGSGPVAVASIANILKIKAELVIAYTRVVNPEFRQNSKMAYTHM